MKNKCACEEVLEAPGIFGGGIATYQPLGQEATSILSLQIQHTHKFQIPLTGVLIVCMSSHILYLSKIGCEVMKEQLLNYFYDSTYSCLQFVLFP